MDDSHVRRLLRRCSLRRKKRRDTLPRIPFAQHATSGSQLLAADRFSATGPKFKLIFGSANELRLSAGENAAELIGLAWLYGLHVRSSIGRRRVLQAEYMLSNMRNRVIELACLREGLPPGEGRGFDDLSKDQKSRFAECYPSSLEREALQHAFQRTMSALIDEIQLRKSALFERIGSTPVEIARCDVPHGSATRAT